MKPFLAIFLALGLGIGGLVVVHQQQRAGGGGDGADGPVMVFCAAGLKKPVVAIAERYRKEFGIEVQLQYGGTGTLLSQLRVAKRGDLFIAADDGAVEAARSGGSIAEVLPLCIQFPVIAVKAGNPKGIASLDDLMQADLRVAVANPEAASIGKSTRAAFGTRWEKFAAKVTVMKPTVTELAADLTLGAVDAAVLWNSTVPQFKGIEAVKAAGLSDRVENVSACVLTATASPPGALKFARYLVAPDKGAEVFREKGFLVAEGDQWSERPQMVIYSGGVNRPAIELTLDEFAEREGAELTTIFNGCGILCAAMKAMTDTQEPRFPDVYFACDLCFVPPVADVFPEVTVLTETEIGIVVPRGNPKGVRTLVDLAEPNLRLGLCNAEQSTLGHMTNGILRSSGLEKAVRANVAVEVPTADFLINQMRAGALDAAIVYLVNYKLQEEHLDFVKISHEGARASQPFGVRADSERRHLANRLLAFFKSKRSRFEESGFTWVGDGAPLNSADIEIPRWLRADSSDDDE